MRSNIGKISPNSHNFVFSSCIVCLAPWIDCHLVRSCGALLSFLSRAQQDHSNQAQSCTKKDMALSACFFHPFSSCTRCHMNFVGTLMARGMAISLYKVIQTLLSCPCWIFQCVPVPDSQRQCIPFGQCTTAPCKRVKMSTNRKHLSKPKSGKFPWATILTTSSNSNTHPQALHSLCAIYWLIISPICGHPDLFLITW